MSGKPDETEREPGPARAVAMAGPLRSVAPPSADAALLTQLIACRDRLGAMRRRSDDPGAALGAYRATDALPNRPTSAGCSRLL